MLTSSIFLTDFHLHFKKIIMLDTLQEVHLKHISYWFTLGFLCFSFLKKVLSLWIAIIYSLVLCKIIMDMKDFLLEQAYSFTDSYVQ